MAVFWWRCGDLHSGLTRFVKVFYILIRRLFSEKPRPSAGFDFPITTEFRLNRRRQND